MAEPAHHVSNKYVNTLKWQLEKNGVNAQALGNEEMADMGGSAPLQHSSSLGVFM